MLPTELQTLCDQVSHKILSELILPLAAIGAAAVVGILTWIETRLRGKMSREEFNEFRRGVDSISLDTHNRMIRIEGKFFDVPLPEPDEVRKLKRRVSKGLEDDVA